MIIYADSLRGRNNVVPSAVFDWIVNISSEIPSIVYEVHFDVMVHLANPKYSRIAELYSHIYIFDKDGAFQKVQFLFGKQEWSIKIVGELSPEATVRMNNASLPMDFYEDEVFPLSARMRSVIAFGEIKEVGQPIFYFRRTTDNPLLDSPTPSDFVSLLPQGTMLSRNPLQKE
jgi:hypothetical protein